MKKNVLDVRGVRENRDANQRIRKTGAWNEKASPSTGLKSSGVFPLKKRNLLKKKKNVTKKLI